MDKQPISFYQINFLARSIARKFKEDKITHVIGLARGGLIPATIISYELDVPLLSYSISSYDDTTKTDEFKINQFVHFTDLKSKDTDPHVLVVDDICDTGDTMGHVTNKLALGSIPYTTACICTKEKFTHWLDHYGIVVSDDKWIVFPWE